MTTPTLQPVYGSFSSIAITSWASLASSSGFTAGASAAAVDNHSALFSDIEIIGVIPAGTTPTINTTALIYALEAVDATPDWPDVFDGTDSAKTLTSFGVGQGFLQLGASITVDATTSNRLYPFRFRLGPLFGGMVPRNWQIFLTHNMVAALKSSSAVLGYQGLNWAIPSI